MLTSVLGLLVVLALIAANGLFVLTEFALTSVDRPEVHRRASTGDRRATSVREAISDLSFQLSGAQLGITVSSLMVGFVAEPLLAHLFAPPLESVGLSMAVAHGIAVAVAMILATTVQMILGELVPQNLAITHPWGVARWVTPWQRFFTRVCRPAIMLFNNTANGIVRLLGREPQEELRSARTPAELGALIRTSAEQGTLPAEVAALLRRSLTFGDKTAGDVLTPRVRVASLRSNQNAKDLLDAAQNSGHSRFPVHTGSLDDLIGVVHVKDAFAVPADRRGATRLNALMVAPLRVPESLHCDDLMPRIREHRLQLAVAIDEYGGTAGVVTLEDLIEELTGQVHDEHDQPEDPDIVPLPDGGWSVAGLVRRDEFQELLGFAPPEGVYETLAGLVLERLGQVPNAGDQVEVAGRILTVTAMEGRRIDRIEVATLEDPYETDAGRETANRPKDRTSAHRERTS